jgi:cell division septum initiation protein DivIVA
MTMEVASSTKNFLNGIEGIRHAPIQEIQKLSQEVDKLKALVHRFIHATPPAL